MKSLNNGYKYLIKKVKKRLATMDTQGCKERAKTSKCQHWLF